MHKMLTWVISKLYLTAVGAFAGFVINAHLDVLTNGQQQSATGQMVHSAHSVPIDSHANTTA